MEILTFILHRRISFSIFPMTSWIENMSELWLFPAFKKEKCHRILKLLTSLRLSGKKEDYLIAEQHCYFKVKKFTKF